MRGECRGSCGHDRQFPGEPRSDIIYCAGESRHVLEDTRRGDLPVFLCVDKVCRPPIAPAEQLQPSSSWKGLHSELYALHREKAPRDALCAVLSGDGELELGLLASYELVTYSLCQKEIVLDEEKAPVLVECILMASPVCLQLELASQEKWLLLRTSLEKGLISVARAAAGAVADDKYITSLTARGKDMVEDLTVAASRSGNEEATRLVLEFVDRVKQMGEINLSHAKGKQVSVRARSCW